MFNTEEINKIIKECAMHTNYTIPLVDEIVHTNDTAYYGKVDNKDFRQGTYLLYLSNDIYQCQAEFQKSVIWHEAIHLYDMERFKNVPKSEFEGIMKTYSEAHATEIQLRNLLKISPSHNTTDMTTRIIPYGRNKKQLGAITSDFINASIQGLKDFQQHKLPKDFNRFTTEFSYYCGYMRTKHRKEADKLINYIVTLYDSHYAINLKMLYQAIIENEYKTTSLIYNNLKAEAILLSFDNIFR